MENNQQSNRRRVLGIRPSITLAVIILIGGSQNILAQQWNTNGSDIYSANSGNVGVGTTTPGFKLDILSSSNIIARFGSSAAAHNQVLINAPTGYNSNLTLQQGGTSQWYLGNRAANNRFSFIESTGAIEVFTILQNGRVGIGTTSPSAQLHVAGANGPSDYTGAPAPDALQVTGGVGGNGTWYSSPGGIGGAINLTGGNGGAPTAGYITALGGKGGSINLTGGTGGPNVFNVGGGAGGDIALNGGTGVANNAGNVILANLRGSVGIGTTTPSASLLHVQSASHTYVRIGAPLAYQSSLAFNDDSNGQDIVLYRPENTRDFSIWTATASNVLRVTQSGNVGIGTTTPSTKLHVVGDVTVTGNIAAKYQDVAEWVPTSQTLLAGTVVVLDSTRSNEVIACSQAYDTKVAGVISAKPGITLGEAGEGKVLVATTGRVRVKVDATRGPIRIGDLLVTSETKGYAMKSEPIMISGRQFHSPGTLIGKALEPLEKGVGEITVLLSLQ